MEHLQLLIIYLKQKKSKIKPQNLELKLLIQLVKERNPQFSGKSDHVA